MTTNQITFANWLKTIPYLDYGKTLKEIEQKAFVSRITVYNWRAGNHNVPKLAQEAINKIAGQELLFPRIRRKKRNSKKSVSVN